MGNKQFSIPIVQVPTTSIPWALDTGFRRLQLRLLEVESPPGYYGRCRARWGASGALISDDLGMTRKPL